MHARVRPSAAFLELAARHGGVVTRAEAEQHGLSRRVVGRLTRDGLWHPLGRGTYLTTAQPPDWTARAWAGLRVGDAGSLLGGRAAAHVHGLLDAPDVIDVWVRGPRAPQSGGPWRFRLDRLSRRTGPSRPPTLCVEETVLDLAGVLPAAGLVDLLFSVALSRRTTARRVRAAMARRGRVPQRALLGDLLAEVAEGVESPLERLYRTDVESAHGLPRPRRQHRSDGTRRDVVYEDFGVVVELDGALWHRARVFRDMRRDNRNQLRGRPTLRYGWQDTVADPCYVAAQVGLLLRQRGWDGTFRRCRRCR
ncbi:type IV toxin-antitoxin system AbiEi family antitoxin domain-containing protein [Desertihabitans brevis]|uniref:type IV toxin-antitoxin system AbiEi family antitoxin domain-containing protein n=1 Tax=Desertihabitans brevis TaxID=2268447 RepID=UPI0013144103|nr:type IV toxin-antitoxin system AbiEi family antitoxin domain-containing protein [Desertihabitans brevis]